ncbi:TrmB family transcriptional regulator [Nitrosarchaeum sp. AC2]|uniref:TrmB family transcriptional regulator n=1 Tax=Nitrosarchaeum sp. AC2 TaxID=2259673 RepID=UPI0015C8427B|nr:helix-turn-helix domain-containing protein [Nitrosarchaeum sp. AC2]QLH10901.1 TrmB family transcriptional regulator [Nitrosarchaeum sp. AC2]
MSTTHEITLFDNDSETELYKHKITLERIKNELISFGLTANQSKVFIYLGKYGSKSASEIAKALQMPRTETYHLVNSLQNMGLVTAELVHPTKYSVMEMKQAIETLVKQEQQRINTLAGKEESLSKLWKEVPFFVVETDESKSEKMQLLHGMGPIINKIKEMTETSTDSIKIYGSIPDVLRLYHSDVFDWIDESSSELQMVISPLSKTPEFISEIDSKKIRVITSDSDKKCFIINDAKEILIFMRNANHATRQTFAWWSDSETLVDMMSSLFDLSWEKGDSLY